MTGWKRLVDIDAKPPFWKMSRAFIIGYVPEMIEHCTNRTNEKLVKLRINLRWMKIGAIYSRPTSIEEMRPLFADHRLYDIRHSQRQQKSEQVVRYNASRVTRAS